MKRGTLKQGLALQAGKTRTAGRSLQKKRFVRSAVAGAVNGAHKTGIKVRKARKRILHVKKIVDLIGKLL